MKNITKCAGRHEDSQISDCQDDEDAHTGTIHKCKIPPAVLCSTYIAIGSLSMRLANLNSTPMQICTTLGALPEEVSSHMVVHPFLMMLQGILCPCIDVETALTDAIVLQRYIFMKLTYTEVGEWSLLALAS